VRPEKRTLIAFVLSAVLHPLVAGSILLLNHFMPSTRPERVQVRPISMRTLSSKQWAQNRGRTAPPDQPLAPLHPKGQVVDVAPGNDVVPQESKYLAETNNAVKKQTRAREQSQKWSVATAKNTPNPEQMPVAKGRAGGKAQQAVTAASRLEEIEGDLGPKPRLSQLFQSAAAAIGTAGTNVDSNDKQGNATSNGEEQRGVDAPVAANGGAAPNDNLQDVDPGEGTFLNTREWRYAAFFNRVKQAVSAKWDPQTQLRKKHSELERVTVVQVALRPDGSLADVFVAKPSGMDTLDREAMAAFERAAPFPNPPQQLVEGGYIRFTFSFSIVNEQLTVPRMLGFGR
jgi:TonB family protein